LEVRDQISALRLIQQKQYVDTADESASADVFAVLVRHGKAVVEQLSVRHGRLLGHKSHALSLQLDQAPEKVLETFVEQYYLAIEEVVELPKEVLLSHAINSTTLAEALFQRHGRRLRFAHQVRGQRQAWRRLAEENARHSMANVLANQQNMGQRLIALQEALDLAVLPERIECFDIS